jgi:enoyl-CoA hydratase/carnithine racemase
MGETVLAALNGDVGSIALNRPEARNAITIELSRALEVAIRELAQQAAVIVIRGAGESFCAGGDFTEMETLRAQGGDAVRELFQSFHDACAAIAEVDVPVISAVHGFAVAGGFELALASDIVLVSDTATLADIHSNFGMVPGGGSTQRLPRAVGSQRALALILSGERLTAAEAVQWGIAYRSFPDAEFDTGVSAFAARLAAKDGAALRRSKRLIRDGLELPLSQGIELELIGVLEHLAGAGAYAKGAA